jgi:hypothetical protein
VLRGHSTERTIQVRQRSGEDGRGNHVQYSSEIEGEVGKKYLLFLSNGLYRLAVAQEAGSYMETSRYYIAQRAPFEVSASGILQPIGVGPPDPRKNLSEAITLLRSSDE